MVENNLEKRMYFLVPYNISPIQQAIQAGHAALEYAQKYGDDLEYIDFIENWKTWIILNGGTTNCKYDYGCEIPNGTLDQDRLRLFARNGRIKYSVFHEPDLNDALSAICLVVDERVFNRKDYPDFDQWLMQKVDSQEYSEENPIYKPLDKDVEYETFKTEVGEDIAFLKELLNTKRLA